MPQLLKPVCLEPVVCYKRRHRGETPAQHNWRVAPALSAARDSPRAATEDPAQLKIMNTFLKKKDLKKEYHAQLYANNMHGIIIQRKREWRSDLCCNMDGP